MEQKVQWWGGPGLQKKAIVTASTTLRSLALLGQRAHTAACEGAMLQQLKNGPSCSAVLELK